MARLRHRIPDARDRLNPAAGHLSARHLGEEREDRDCRQPARRGRLLHFRVRARLHRLRRAPHRPVARGIAVGRGCPRDAAHPSRVHPRPHAHVDTGALLRRAAVGDPVDGERGDHRPDFAVHGKHHPSALSEHERPPVPPHAPHRPGVLHLRRPDIRPALEADDVRHGAERLHRDAGGRAGAAHGGNLLEESEQYGRDPIRGVRTRRLADRGFHRGGRRRAADAGRPRVLHLRHGPRRYRAKRRAAGASPQRPPLVRSRPDSATIRAPFIAAEVSMFARLMPHEGRFFTYFSEHAALILQGAVELKAMMDDMGETESRAHNIKAIETKADTVTYQTIQLLHTTFITPIDRDEIHQLITRMDDILDLMEDVSQSVFLYDIRKIPEEAKRLAEICVACTENVKAAVDLLNNMGNAEKIMKICADIDRLETDADQVLRSAMAKLFRNEPDTRELIKLKEIYEHLETVTDKCEDVANIIEGFVIENS